MYSLAQSPASTLVLFFFCLEIVGATLRGDVRLQPDYADLTVCQQLCVAGQDVAYPNDYKSVFYYGDCTTKDCFCAPTHQTTVDEHLQTCWKSLNRACARDASQYNGAAQWIAAYCAWTPTLSVVPSALTISSALPSTPPGSTTDNTALPSSETLAPGSTLSTVERSSSRGSSTDGSISPSPTTTSTTPSTSSSPPSDDSGEERKLGIGIGIAGLVVASFGAWFAYRQIRIIRQKKEGV